MADMKDQEKSVLLVKAMGYGWEIHEDHNGCFMLDSEDVLLGEGNLYDPANMALAWRAKRWMHEEDDRCMVTTFTDWYRRHAVRLSRMDDADAQRIWLDKIHELIIEAEVDGQPAP